MEAFLRVMREVTSFLSLLPVLQLTTIPHPDRAPSEGPALARATHLAAHALPRPPAVYKGRQRAVARGDARAARAGGHGRRGRVGAHAVGSRAVYDGAAGGAGQGGRGGGRGDGRGREGMMRLVFILVGIYTYGSDTVVV
jgi:hypothetical protein